MQVLSETRSQARFLVVPRLIALLSSRVSGKSGTPRRYFGASDGIRRPGVRVRRNSLIDDAARRRIDAMVHRWQEPAIMSAVQLGLARDYSTTQEARANKSLRPEIQTTVGWRSTMSAQISSQSSEQDFPNSSSRSPWSANATLRAGAADPARRLSRVRIRSSALSLGPAGRLAVISPLFEPRTGLDSTPIRTGFIIRRFPPRINAPTGARRIHRSQLHKVEARP